MPGNHNVTKDFQNSAGLRSVNISKFFNNAIKVIYLEINNENANTYFNTIFQVA